MFDQYFSQYGLIAVFACVALLIPLGMYVASWFAGFFGVRPSNPSTVKLSIYECGFESVPGSWNQFNFRYYAIALIFLIFDVEVIFMIPWAANYGVMSKEFGFFVLAEMIVFVGILMIGWIYAVKKGAFSKIY
ncbi:MAG: NADH-quinone oxidoreductase subunit A [Chloroflexi bacterium]|nr:NADH-quinone oxidoreductase subunit A [Chloroflexota bacterium]|tara:strand:+ start:443 stop:841 length:399 start_codon:yes stop_codon:yes gene_type:complete